MHYFAHRGDSSNYPENTILAFRKAIEKGVDGIELDVHKTKDHQLVVIHDEDIERTFCGRGLVKDYTLEELKTFACRKELFRHNEACKIPTLEEVLVLVQDHNLILNIEFKTDCIHYEHIEEDVVKMIYKYQLQDKILLSSFNHKSLEIVRSLDTKLKTGVLFEDPIDDAINYTKNLGANALHPDIRLVNAKMIQEAQEAGLQVNVYTVNNPVHVRKCLEVGINAIFTDYPQLCREILEAEGV